MSVAFPSRAINSEVDNVPIKLTPFPYTIKRTFHIGATKHFTMRPILPQFLYHKPSVDLLIKHSLKTLGFTKIRA